MGNFAAVYLLSRSGRFDNLFGESLLIDGIGNVVAGAEEAIEHAKKKREENKIKKAKKEWEKVPDRFAALSSHNPVIENYLKEGTKLVWNVDYDGKASVDAVSKRGKKETFKEDQLKKEDVAEYRKFVEKQLEMIEPPSFVERVMFAHKKLAETKAGRIASAASLGLVPAAAATAALAARAYGATRHFVMEKLHLNDENNKKSFKERLADIRNLPKYRKDLEKLPYIEDIMQKTADQKSRRNKVAETSADFAGYDALSKHNRFNMEQPSSSKEFEELTSLQQDPLLANYLGAGWGIRNDGTGYTPGGFRVAYYTNDGKCVKTDQKDAGKVVEEVNKKPLNSETLDKYIAKHAKALEMIEPATKTELLLIKQIHQMTEGSRYASFEKKAPVVESVQETVKLYMAEKQKENKNYSKEDLMARLKDLDKRSMVETRLEKMTTLQKTLKNSGR